MQNLKVFSHVASLQGEIIQLKNLGKSIGFVPTMGALHEGHLSLIKEAKKRCNIVVVSIFVNPTQFNNQQDLDKYPRMIDQDIELLKHAAVDIVFTPSIDEIYPINSTYKKTKLGKMDKIMEGKFRPGHFDGVVQVVKRLFEIICPEYAFFGKKDFQQLAVIRFMTQFHKLPVKIVGCKIIREKSGLAMSSRNMRLTEAQKMEATHMFKTLKFVKNNALKYSPNELQKLSKIFFKTSQLKLEYLEIVHPKTLESLNHKWVTGATCCIACYCGDVRLIDNIQI